MTQLPLADLPTPVLILDRARLAANAARMRHRAAQLGLSLRPHMKTAKSATVAAIAHNGAKGPVTVSTLAEADYFAKAGFRDVLYAVPVAPQKLDQAAAIMQQHGCDLKLITDNIAVAEAIAAAGRRLGVTFRVLVKIDCGLGRAGIPPDAPELLPLAAALSQPGCELAGVLTHAGHSYHAHNIADIKRIAEDERLAVVTAAEHLRAAGHACAIVSVGSTPTALHAEHYAGVTEMRPGNYMFFDLFQAGVGSCRMEDIAVAVLATVVSHHPGRGHLLLDAGGLALSKDTGANEHAPGTGYGLVRRPDAARPLDGLAVRDVHQEHGLVGRRDGGAADFFADHPPGSRLLVLPNHSCMTAAMYDRYYVTDPAIDGGLRVVAEWDRVNGW